MKKLLSVIAIVGALTSSGRAEAFNVQANVQVNQMQATAVVFNRFNRPIYCDINVQGFTYYGQSLNSYMNGVVIYPGMNGYAYVYSNPGNPFVNARGNARCQWY